MTSLQAFNGLIDNFVTELRSTFPEEEGLEIFQEEFKTLLKIDQRGPLELFMAAMGPHTDYIMTKNPAIFDQLKIPNLDLKKLWAMPLSDGTRNAIWQHLHTIFLLGTTIKHMPADMLSNIETMAKECARKIENGEGLDFASIASGMAGMLDGGALGGGAGLPKLE